jgi:ABC-type multidrug transport system fused ATPase/permease subunit
MQNMAQPSLETAKEAYLRFTSSQINSHASMAIGFSVILFAYLGVVVTRFPRVQLSLCPICITLATIQYLVALAILFVILFPLLFTAFRFTYYGTLADRAMNYNVKVESLEQLHKEITESLASDETVKLFGLVPVCWFNEGMTRFNRGVCISMVLSFIICAVFAWVFFVSL